VNPKNTMKAGRADGIMAACSRVLAKVGTTMRATLFALCLLVLPVPARAEPNLSLGVLEGRESPRPHLEVPELSLDLGSAELSVTRGDSSEGPRIEPGLAFILGIVPGFGVGHYFARAPQWTVWLIADIVIFVVWPGGFIFTDSQGYTLAGLLVLAERIFEGVSAYQSAGGGASFAPPAQERTAFSPAELARPVGRSRAVL